MKLRAMDMAAYSISLSLMAVGIAVIAVRLSESVTMARPTTTEELDHYMSLHRTSYPGLALAALGAALLVYRLASRETPLWEIRTATKVRTRHSPVIIAFGILIVVLASGGAAILLHQAYNLPDYYESTYEQSSELAIGCMFAGFIGAGIFLYGVLFSRVPNLEFADSESFFFNRPLWQCLAMIGAGIAIAVASYVYGSLEFEEYIDRQEEGMLSLIVMAGMLLAFVVLLSGLGMLAKSSFSIRFRGELNPVDRVQDKGH